MGTSGHRVPAGTSGYQRVPVGTSVPGTIVPGVPGVPRRLRPNQRCYLHLWCRFFLNFSGLECSHGPCVRGLTTPPTSAFPLLGTWQGEVRQDPQWQLVHTVSVRYSWPPWLHTLTRNTNSFPVLWWQYFFLKYIYVKLQILPNSVATFLFSVQFPHTISEMNGFAKFNIQQCVEEIFCHSTPKKYFVIRLLVGLMLLKTHPITC